MCGQTHAATETGWLRGNSLLIATRRIVVDLNDSCNATPARLLRCYTVTLDDYGGLLFMASDADQARDDSSETTDAKREKLEVTIHNEDDGAVYRFDTQRHELLARVIREFYEKKLRREPYEDDRLKCESNGEDVFVFSELRFGEYLDAGHCPELVWLFAGGTGGAWTRHGAR